MPGRLPALLTAAAAIALICTAACTAADGPDPDEDAEMRVVDRDEEELLHMPRVPPVRDGHLSVAGAGDLKPEYIIDGSWPASVLRCDSSGFTQLIARGEDFGAAILFAPPDSGTESTTYELRDAEEGPIPQGTARIGVQWMPDDRPYVFRGRNGTLELTRTRERLAGYFTTEFYETSFRDSMYMAGSFAGIRIVPGAGPECELIPSEEPDEGPAAER